MTESKALVEIPQEAIKALPLMPSPAQRQMLDEWFAGMRDGPEFVNQCRHMAQGGYTTAVWFMAMLMTFPGVDNGKRLRVVKPFSKRIRDAFLDKGHNLCKNSKWDMSVNLKHVPVVVTLTNKETKTSTAFMLDVYNPKQKGVDQTNVLSPPGMKGYDAAELKATDYVIFDGCGFTNEETVSFETVRRMVGAKWEYCDRCGCTFGHECVLHAAETKKRLAKEEEEMKRTGRKCVCTCVTCFPDQEFPDPAWQCMCSRCPKSVFWPYEAVRASSS